MNSQQFFDELRNEMKRVDAKYAYQTRTVDATIQRLEDVVDVLVWGIGQVTKFLPKDVDIPIK
jgi:hypothetical protein